MDGIISNTPDDPSVKGRFDLAAVFYPMQRVVDAAKQNDFDRSLLIEPLLQLIGGFAFVGILMWLTVIRHPANFAALWWGLLAVTGLLVYTWRGIIPLWRDARLKLIGAALYFPCFFFLLLYKIDNTQVTLRDGLFEISGLGLLLFLIGKWRNHEFFGNPETIINHDTARH